MVIRSDMACFLTGAVVFVLGIMPLCFLIAFLKGDAHYVSVPWNILLFASLGAPLSAARVRIQSHSPIFSYRTLRLWVLSVAWSSVFIFLALGTQPHVPTSAQSRVGFTLVVALGLSVICFIPDCRPRLQNAP